MSESDTPQKLVLIADDDIEIRRILARALDKLDCEVIQAADGEEALTLVIQEHPDVLVLDVMMPTLSGWEICKYVRGKSEYADIRVLMLTAIGRTVNEMTSPLYGADAHLDKPFDVHEVVSTVQSLLDATRTD